MMDAKLLVPEDILERCLGIVEGAVHRQGEDIGRTGACHLALLQRRGAAVRIKDEDGSAGLAKQAVDRRRAGVAGGGPKHVDGLVAQGALPGVEVAQQLQGKVLEGERRPMEQLQHEGLVIEPHKRRHLGSVEACVAGARKGAKLLHRDVRREVGEKLRAQVCVSKLRIRRKFRRQVGKRLRHIQAAIGREPGRDGIGEA